MGIPGRAEGFKSDNGGTMEGNVLTGAERGLSSRSIDHRNT